MLIRSNPLRNVETADGHVARRLTVGYVLVSSGTCQSNNRDEVPQADCETAAISLGLSDTSVFVGTDSAYYAVRPEGCIYDGSSNLRFNTLTTSLGCGADGHDCICADHSNAGSVSPSFSFIHHVLSCSWPCFFLIACDV